MQILQTLAIGPYQRSDTDLHTVFPVWESCPVDEWRKDLVRYEYRKTPWYNHPAVRMWKGYEESLARYAEEVCYEWKYRRRFHDTCLVKVLPFRHIGSKHIPPPWLGNEAFHASHRSNLLRKDPAHYSQFGWTEPDNLPYIWPV